MLNVLSYFRPCYTIIFHVNICHFMWCHFPFYVVSYQSVCQVMGFYVKVPFMSCFSTYYSKCHVIYIKFLQCIMYVWCHVFLTKQQICISPPKIKIMTQNLQDMILGVPQGHPWCQEWPCPPCLQSGILNILEVPPSWPPFLTHFQ